MWDGSLDEALIERAIDIARDVAGPCAQDVDRRARFPKEAIDALRDESLLSVLVPTSLGGAGASLATVSAIVTALSRACASTGMIYAMHQIQVACLVKHGRNDYLASFLRDGVVGEQALLASATTEINIGGEVRTSHCAVESDATRFHLEKTAPVISYGEYADAVLATARRGPDSPANDQVLVLCQPPGLGLVPIGEWDTLGFRGTCSLGYALTADGPADAILSDPYGAISGETMLPVSHVLWSSVWLGLADIAVRTARAHVRADAHRHPGTTPLGATHAAELVALHNEMEYLVRGARERYEAALADHEQLESMEFALAMNSLKVRASKLVLEIATLALGICGMEGYREDSQRSLARVVRDAHGAALMVSNDRILGHNAQMLLVAKDA